MRKKPDTIPDGMSSLSCSLPSNCKSESNLVMFQSRGEQGGCRRLWSAWRLLLHWTLAPPQLRALHTGALLPELTIRAPLPTCVRLQWWSVPSYDLNSACLLLFDSKCYFQALYSGNMDAWCCIVKFWSPFSPAVQCRHRHRALLATFLVVQNALEWICSSQMSICSTVCQVEWRKRVTPNR